jgi:dTDP-4-amino-4,6-dideoxygalactose transaminase
MVLNVAEIGVSRSTIIDALRAEGVPGIMAGYQNLHKLPLFADQLTYRNNPLPYSLLPSDRALTLRSQFLPQAESLHNATFFGIHWCAFTLTDSEVDSLIYSFKKVWESLHSLESVKRT